MIISSKLTFNIKYLSSFRHYFSVWFWTRMHVPVLFGFKSGGQNNLLTDSF